jgi:hypothetical protein
MTPVGADAGMGHALDAAARRFDDHYIVKRAEHASRDLEGRDHPLRFARRREARVRTHSCVWVAPVSQAIHPRP